MITSAQERRRYVRLDHHIPMQYKRIEVYNQGFKGSLMRNISQGGVRVAIYEFLPLNLRLAVEIPLSLGVRPVEGLGRVAWVNKAAFSEQYDAGIEFIDLNQENKAQIADFILDRKTGRVL